MIPYKLILLAIDLAPTYESGLPEQITLTASHVPEGVPAVIGYGRIMQIFDPNNPSGGAEVLADPDTLITHLVCQVCGEKATIPTSRYHGSMCPRCGSCLMCAYGPLYTQEQYQTLREGGVVKFGDEGEGEDNVPGEIGLRG